MLKQMHPMLFFVIIFLLQLADPLRVAAAQANPKLNETHQKGRARG